ncbi:sensor histidine kinase [Kocuria coralli]|nr:histidine kinase [Kocuria coralli]
MSLHTVAATRYHERVAAERLDLGGTAVIAAAAALVSLGILGMMAMVLREDPAGDAPAVTALALSSTTATVSLQSLTLLWLARAPGVSLLIAAGLPVILAFLVPNELYSTTAVPVAVAAFSAGLRMPFRRVRRSAAGAAMLLGAGQVANNFGSGRSDPFAVLLESLAQAVIVVGLPLVPAMAIAAQRTVRAAQSETITALRRERDAQVGEAIALERAAMARELHDIAAHHLSGISLMASAVARQVESDPGGARAGAMQIREQSTAILQDLRRLVGLLRSETDGESSVKTLAALPALVESAERTSGTVLLDLRLADDRDPWRGIGPLAQLAAYRMVQESLTNAARHAPGAARTVVVDDTDPRHLLLSVGNASSPASLRSVDGTGFGLIGMRERATLVGGAFEAGPTPGNGWKTLMTIPRDSGHRDAQEASP